MTADTILALYRRQLRRLRLTTLEGWWIVVTCCGRSVALPCGLLAQQQSNPTLGHVLDRLVCQSCRAGATRAYLTDRADAADSVSGGPTEFTRIALLP